MKTIGGSSMEHHHRVNGKHMQNSYSYSTHPLNAYDANVTTTSQFNTNGLPSSTSSYSTAEEQHNINHDYQNVTYSNVVFLPDNTCQQESINSIIDPNQSYILPSDSRLYNTYIRSDTDINSMHYDENLISTHQPNHSHHMENYQQLQPDDLNASVYNNLTSNDHHMTNDTVNPVTSAATEIIMQEVNGEFYHQIQNIYVDASHSAGQSIVPTLIGGSDHHFTEYDETQSYYPPETTYEIESGLIICPDKIHASQNDVVYVSNDENGAAEQVQMYMDNNQSFDSYKNEYTILEPINSQIMHQHIHPEQQHQEQEMNATTYHQHHRTNNMAMVQQQVAMSMGEKDQQRLLLESTMSPLLAAVNDITSRDEHFQRYLTTTNANLSKESNNILSKRRNIDKQQQVSAVQYSSINTYSGDVDVSIPPQLTTSIQSENCSSSDIITSTSNLYRNNLKITNMHSATNEFVDINDMDFIENRAQIPGYVENNCQENLLLRRSQRRLPRKDDELTVSDKRVPSRAWATLPTAYLYIGKPSDGLTDHTVFSKKDIPLRTKFGPLEGDIRSCTEAERNQLKTEQVGPYPFLFLGHSSIVDVSNEYTSNWMRFVRMATTFREQNLQLHQSDDNKLYFQSCQIIGAKQEFKIGYSAEYARHYGLKTLEPNDAEQVGAIYAKNHPWPCFECEAKFESYEALQTHLNEHDKLSDDPVKNSQRRKRRVARRHRLTARKISGPTVRYACCYCSEVFTKYLNLKRHNEFVHSVVDDCDAVRTNSALAAAASASNQRTVNVHKNLRCDICCRTFPSIERLEKHNLMHKAPIDPKLVQCTYCPERLLTPSALAMHIKSHLFKNRLFSCLFCSERFRLASEVLNHVQMHMENGVFTCQYCNKIFKKYMLIRKHIRCYHSSVKHTCPECGKECTSRTKLKHHRLKHSDVREFLCSDCGKQFKRKDKLREHIIAIHIKKAAAIAAAATVPAAAEKANEKKEIVQPTPPIKMPEKIPPDDYARYIYKCHDCLLGFKRRGMLVNHLAKRHPNISIDSVPELNLPILKAQRCYYCQYCDKVYKSSGKRKAHIIKNHPGAELPQSSRQQGNRADGTMKLTNGLINGTFSETVGNVTTDPQRCLWCHKQYGSKARLVQHQRKEHSEHLSDIVYSDETVAEEIGVEIQIQQSHIVGQHQQQIYGKNPQPPYEYVAVENKLLKLSSAALESSLKDDLQLFTDSPNEIASKVTSSSSSSSSSLASNRDTESNISQVDVNFKVVNADFIETSTASSNGDLNHLPQLFEDIEYMDIKPVAISEDATDCYMVKKLNYEFTQNSG